eukprot:13505114-Ditylum_brightwellii.AAC.1
MGSTSCGSTNKKDHIQYTVEEVMLCSSHWDKMETKLWKNPLERPLHIAQPFARPFTLIRQTVTKFHPRGVFYVTSKYIFHIRGMRTPQD